MTDSTVDRLVHENMLRNDPAWATCKWYHVGDRVVWEGKVLRCGTDHYAGGDATDPWDPGWGWDARRQSRLWAVVLAA